MAHPEHSAPQGSNIDISRLFDDLRITDVDLQNVAALDIPTEIRVPSVSPIKTSTVADALRILLPAQKFNVVGIKVPSGVDEQPLGQTTIDGALNRLHNGIAAREQVNPGEVSKVAWFSIENGLFRVSDQHSSTSEADENQGGITQFTEDADLTSQFDPEAEYDDRAVVAVQLPTHPTIVQVSPASEAVRFPSLAVVAAAEAEGGLAEHTAGSKLHEMGLIQDKQNPHTELTARRPEGPLTRQDQMARVIVRSLVALARQYADK